MPKLLGTLSVLAILPYAAAAQSLGNAGTLRGTVRDGSGAPIPRAAVEIAQPISGFRRTTATSIDGLFAVYGIPPNTYTLHIAVPGFVPYRAEITVRSSVPIEREVVLELTGQQTTVTVEASSPTLVEAKPSASDTIDRRFLAALPANAPDSGLNDAIVLTTPGVAADSNGFFHPLGDHAQVSYVIDGQPISDQRNKVFSTSVPANAIQSMELISGSPAAEYGDKTSLVINAATRSGLGRKPAGSFAPSYGSFGTVAEEATVELGTPYFGSFTAANAERSGRFLDTPEFRPIHATGNTTTLFERLDYQPNSRDAFHLNLMAARNWFQVPNTYDQPLQDQRQKVVSFNLAPGYQRTLDAHTLVSVNAFLRADWVRYYPSRDPLHDSPATLSQSRRLANAGIHADVARTQGRHNWKAGFQSSLTHLREAFSLAITDSSYNLPGSPDFLPSLLPHDLTRGGEPYRFLGAANIWQHAWFAQDSIAFGPLTLNLGLRYDRYRGLTSGNAFQPRAAISWLIKSTGTVIRAGYSHTLETPTNENLVASSSTGPGGLASNLFQGSVEQRPIELGSRNQYDAGIQQSAGRWLLLDISYFRKYTRNAFDFDALFSTPILFPIGWHRSKLDGVAARIRTVEFAGFRAYATMGHANARFFGPEVGGIIFNSNLSIGAYRQDHDQVYQQNVNLHYQPVRQGWWADFTWRYDSGLVIGAVTNLADALALTGNQQAAIGFYCGSHRASATRPITTCASSDYGAAHVGIPAEGTHNPDHNPPRAHARHILNIGIGKDDIFRSEHVRTSLRLTVLNLTNRAALYNFLSPFSGTHWVAPRTWQAQLGWNF